MIRPSRRADAGRGQRRREDLKRAEMILKDLVVESPEDPDVRALQARVLMARARSLRDVAVGCDPV